MRDLLLASMQRLMLQHSDGPMAVDDAALWRDMVDAGFARMRLGADEIDLSDALAMVSLAAQFGARVPLGDVLVADWLLLRADVVDAAPCTFAPESDFLLHDDGSLSGAAYDFAGASDCRHLLSCAVDKAGALHLVIAEIGARLSRANIAGEPRYSVTVRHAPARAYATDLSATDIRAVAGLARCAQMAGAMSRVIDLVLEHAATRVQFGKPLAKLQAVQQLQALIAGQLALSFAALDRAVCAADVTETAFFAAIAKAVVSEAAGKVAAAGHQILGAMGVSQEHELQHHTRALWSWRDEIGAEDEWRAVTGRRVLQGGGAALWPMLAQS
jgi:acyl-CoA dehydrogenase